MNLLSIVRPELVFPHIDTTDRDQTLHVISEKMAEIGAVPDANRLYEELVRREELGSTGIGGGVAIPHCKSKGVDEVTLAIATSLEGVDFAAADGEPVRLFFVVVSPPNEPTEHLQALAAVSRWVKQTGEVERVVEQAEPKDVLDLLSQEAESP